MMFDSGGVCDEADSGWARRPLMGAITSRDHASAATCGDYTDATAQLMRAAHKHYYLFASNSLSSAFLVIFMSFVRLIIRIRCTAFC